MKNNGTDRVRAKVALRGARVTRAVTDAVDTARVEARLARQEQELRALEARLAKLGKRGGRRRSGGGSGWLLLLVGGGYLLARRPEWRQRVLDLVERVSPQGRERLTQAGRTARSLIGEVWIDRAGEEATPGARTATYGATSTTQAISSPAALREADRPR